MEEEEGLCSQEREVCQDKPDARIKDAGSLNWTWIDQKNEMDTESLILQ